MTRPARLNTTYTRTAKCELHNCQLIRGECLACAAQAEVDRRKRVAQREKELFAPTENH